MDTNPVLRYTCLDAILAQLPPVVHAALRTLRKAGGALPHIPFARQFGQIRPYRPWKSRPRRPRSSGITA